MVSQEEMEIPDCEKWSMRKKKSALQLEWVLWLVLKKRKNKKRRMDWMDLKPLREECSSHYNGLFGCNPEPVEVSGRTHIGFKRYWAVVWFLSCLWVTESQEYMTKFQPSAEIIAWIEQSTVRFKPFSTYMKWLQNHFIQSGIFSFK